ncbi:MAG TPA: hypothetical protein VGL25_08990 [Casimicrobiaceae bacterium]
MKERRQRAIRIAPAVSRRYEARQLEESARELFAIKKIFLSDGRDAAARALETLTLDGPDPSDASAQAFVSVSAVEAWGDSWDTSQAGRRKGGKESGKAMADKAAEDAADIRNRATKLLEDGKHPKDVAGIIKSARRYSLPKIYRALRSHSSGHWQKS